MKNIFGNTKKAVGLLLLALGMMFSWGISLAVEQTASPQIQACPDSAIQHWDKIVFMITRQNVAANLQVPFRSPLDVKVLDDPNTVADLKLKVMDFFRTHLGSNIPDFREAIDIISVAYAISGCVAVPNSAPPNQTACSSTVTSGPVNTTATAICGLTCPSAHVTGYTGVGTPFMSFIDPLYICNGQPTLGTSSITCSC